MEVETINKLLSNELLVIIFKQVFTKYLPREYTNDVNKYQNDCRYCKNKCDINIEYHKKEHNKIKLREQIKHKYSIMNKDFDNIRKLILTCRTWKDICYIYFKDLFMIKGITKRKNNLRIIMNKIMKYVILDPDITQVNETMWGINTIKVEPWKYNHARNIILTSRQLRNKYYESVVDQECKRINWCTLCHQPVRITMDKRPLIKVMKGKTNRMLKKYRHWIHRITRQEGDNRPVLINTLVKFGYKGCEVHCLESF